MGIRMYICITDYACISVHTMYMYVCTVFLYWSIPQSLYVYSHSVKKLKELIKEQTNLDPYYQELFYENLPYYLGQPEPAAKLPITTVRALILHLYSTS